MVLARGTLQTGLAIALGLGLTLGLLAAAGDGIQSVLFGVDVRDQLLHGAVALPALMPARRRA
jgi:hypothetical protein